MTRMIYLCDDDEGVRESLRFLLRQHEFEVSAHASGCALLAEVDAAKGPLRGVFVLDVRMEPMPGPQVHQQLIARGLGKRNPIVFLSGHGDIPLAVAAMAQGAFSFVEKPYTDNLLVTLLERASAMESEWHERAERGSRLATLLQRLTPQQRRVMPHVAAGELNKIIADRLAMSVRAVEVHRAKLFENLHVGSAAELATLVAEMRANGLDVCGAMPPSPSR